jgi:hypothetical protein
VAFHAQQAAEKALKAFLAFHDEPFRKTHGIEEIGRASRCGGAEARARREGTPGCSVGVTLRCFLIEVLSSSKGRRVGPPDRPDPRRVDGREVVR